MRDVYVAGSAMTAFGKHLDRSLGDLSRESFDAAIADAGVPAGSIEYVCFGNAAAGLITGQEMIRGQVALKGADLGEAAIINVDNACASGSTAAHLAWLAVASGRTDTAVAAGTEKLLHPDKARSFAAIAAGTDLTMDVKPPETPGCSVMMGSYALECSAYADKYGAIEDALAAIAVKNRGHASANPRAQFRTPITASDVRESRLVADPLRMLTCSPMTDGSATVVFTAAPSGNRPVRIVASEMRSYQLGRAVVRRAADAGYSRAGVRPEDIDVLQLHDACAFAELVQFEQIGMAEEGTGAAAVLAGETSLGGRVPVNTDGGLLSRGHALGATGIAQIVELVEQLQGRSGARQVEGAATAMAVNAGGWMGDDYATTVVTILARA